MIRWDVPVNYQLGFQDSASPVMEGIINFHNYVMVFISFIVTGVVYILFFTCVEFAKSKSFISHKYLTHGTLIEIIWTITPAIILVLIA